MGNFIFDLNFINAIVGLTLIILLLDIYLPPLLCSKNEAMTVTPLFRTKSDKAKAIADYYNRRRGQISYIDYRQALSGGSNIVEYYYITQFAQQRPQITIAEIVSLI